MQESTKMKIFYNIGKILLIIGCIYLGYYGIIERFAHPDLTETQLFNKYFFNYLLGGIIAVAGYAFIMANDRYKDFED